MGADPAAPPETAADAPAVAEVVATLRPLLLGDGLVRAIASGRRRGRSVAYRRLELRPVDLSAGRHLQLTAYDDTQAHTHNIAPADLPAEVDAALLEPYAHWHVDLADETVQLRVTKKGRVQTHRARREQPVAADTRHDRAKRRRLDESDPVFQALDISTRDGHVKPSRMAKFRQVQDLLAALDPIVDHAVAAGPGAALGADHPLRVVDLGCGNAYLTFGAHAYLTRVLGLPVEVVGVDVKGQSREHNTALAVQLGADSRLAFVQSPIADVELAAPPDLVLALHACDTATDDALARAIRWQAPVIVAAPCCHHDVQRQLRGTQPPDPYGIVTRHGILRERLADVLTDALRAAILRLLGYRVEVFEFVDTRHTPRNALIRAVRVGTSASPRARHEYERLCAEWGVLPALARRLADTHPELLPAAGPGQGR